jgi:UDP-glucose 4-epimerase
VTGASGNVGTALLRRLHEDGRWMVTGVARRVPDLTCPPYGRADWLPCDIGAPVAARPLTEAMAGADAVVHLAWAINPATTDPPMRHTNVTGTAHVLRAAADAGVPHIVCASSVAAYRPPPRRTTVDEDWPCDGVPGSAYSQGKVHLERTLDRFVEDHPNTVVTRIRPCAIVQRDAAGQFARWLLGPLVPEAALGRVPLPFWRGLRAQLVHSRDVADAIRRILDRRAGGAFNLAAGPVLDATGLAAGIGGPVLPLPRSVVVGAAWATWRLGLQPAHPGWVRLADRAALVDTRRAADELDWQPVHDAPSALADVVTGMRALAGTRSVPLAARQRVGLVRRVRSVNWGKPVHQAQ